MRNLVGLVVLGLSTGVLANSIEIPMHGVEQMGTGKKFGLITATDYKGGVLFTPSLKGFNASPSARGFHVHEGNSCDNFGNAALGHFDPKKTGKHLGPYADGHQGDIQTMVINKNGSATIPVFAPNLTLADIAGHTLIIHANGDNYSDTPNALGGGGDRIACGIIPGASSAAKVTPAATTSTPAASTAAPASTTSKPAVSTATTTPAPTAKPVATDTSATNDVKAMSTDEQIKQLMERKKKLQALQEQSRQQLKNAQQ